MIHLIIAIVIAAMYILKKLKNRLNKNQLKGFKPILTDFVCPKNSKWHGDEET